jgi:hypothetical protein
MRVCHVSVAVSRLVCRGLWLHVPYMFWSLRYGDEETQGLTIIYPAVVHSDLGCFSLKDYALRSISWLKPEVCLKLLTISRHSRTSGCHWHVMVVLQYLLPVVHSVVPEWDYSILDHLSRQKPFLSTSPEHDNSLLRCKLPALLGRGYIQNEYNRYHTFYLQGDDLLLGTQHKLVWMSSKKRASRKISKPWDAPGAPYNNASTLQCR